jgi:hypothetical protein
MIGNFRAWPYWMNRSDQNTSPAIKLNPNDDPSNGWIEALKIANLDRNTPNVQNKLRDAILEKSFCNDPIKNNIWLKINQSPSKPDHLRPIKAAILRRCFLLCHHWFNELNISSLKSNTSDHISNFINKRSWKQLEKSEKNKHKKTSSKESHLFEFFYVEEDISDETYTYWLMKIEKINSDSVDIFLYIGFPDYPDEVNVKDNIVFGIYDAIKTGDQKKEEPYIESRFTLWSDDCKSYIILLCDFMKWINEALPASGIEDDFASVISAQFVGSLNKEARAYLEGVGST